MVLTTWGRSSGFCIDPIEKKPLYHFFPGSGVLSFGTAGCNLTCKFCQNADISRSRDMDRLLENATPEAIAKAARTKGVRSVAFTYNDPVVFAEYAMDTAEMCRAFGIANVAVTAGYLHTAPRQAFFAQMDAANIDLKSFSESFYRQLCGAHLAPVLETLLHVRHETACWLEITTLLIPGCNDSDREISQLSAWITRELGVDVPLHFSAFHPAWKMRETPPTSPASLQRARRIALDAGLRHVYLGNVADRDGSTTFCPGCHIPLIERRGYDVLRNDLREDARCPHCQSAVAGRF